MNTANIIRSSTWSPAVSSSSGSNFTTGISILNTSTEEIFTIPLSASAIVISSNRNGSSRRLSSRARRSLWVGAQRSPFADAVMPTRESMQEPDVGPEPGGLVDTAPVRDPPKAPPKSDKIELTIDSLQNFELLRPIRVVVESLGDKVFVAEAPDLNVSTTANSVGGALILIKEHISTIYEGYTSKKNLDPERARQLKNFELYIGKTRRNWL